MSGLLRNTSFVRLWTGQSVSEFGYHLTLIALPLVAILQLDAGATEMGLFVGAGMAPLAFAWPFAGVLVDRVDRRKVLLTTYVGRGLLLAWIPVATAAGILTMLQLVVVYFLVSALQVVFNVAYPSLVPSLVGGAALIEANSKLEMTRSAAMIIGPSVAGFLVEAINPSGTVAVDVACYLVATVSIMTLRPPERTPATVQAPTTMWRQIAEGWSTVFGDRLLRPMAISSGIMNGFFYIRTPLLMLFVVKELGFSAGQLGLIMAAAGPGALLGSALAGRLPRLGLGNTIVGAAFLGGVPVLAVPFTPDNGMGSMALLVASTFAVSCGVQIYSINLVSARQVMTPDRLLGRVNATFRWIAWGMAPFAATVSGFLADWIGLRGAIAVAGVGLFLPGLLLLLSPVRRVRSMRELAQENKTQGADR